MPKVKRVLKGSADLEIELSAAAARVAKDESALLSRLPYKSPVGLYKDIVVFFHERSPVEEPESTADHDGVIADLKKSFRYDLERHATVGDLDISKTVALEILRVLVTPEEPDDNDNDEVDDDDDGDGNGDTGGDNEIEKDSARQNPGTNPQSP